MALRNAFDELSLEDTQLAVLAELGTKLDEGGTVVVVDAAEDVALSWQPIDFATSGAHTIVTVAPGSQLRLRRFLATGGDPDADPPANPVLTLTLGGQSLRSTILIGRFDITGGDGEDLVITSSKAGQVDGCVGYVLI